MSKTPPDMTPTEFALMKLLWELGRGTVSEVRAAHNDVSGSDLAYTTVMTLLNRMVCKGALKVDKRRQPYTYRPACRRESVLRERLRDFVDTVFDGKVDSLVLHLVEDDSLSLEELRRIEQRIADRGDEECEE